MTSLDKPRAARRPVCAVCTLRAPRPDRAAPYVSAFALGFGAACAAFAASAGLAFAGDSQLAAPSLHDADAGNAPTPAVITPPVALDLAPVGYPDGGEGEAEVVCELVVGEGGQVAEARIVAGDDPFGAAVLAAAPSFRFEPATRDGAPVRARVRIRIAFHAPPSAAALSADAGVSLGADAGAPAVPKPPAEVEEVTVLGDRHEQSETQLRGSEVRQMPGAFGDAFRALEALPGVTPIVSGLPFFFVRGAPPGNVGYFLDGVRVPLLYHLGFGPSVVHPGLVDHVDFFPGGYPAQYGRFVGGILAGETRPPATALSGEANIRLFDTGALVSAPFAEGRGTVLLAGRYSYTAAVLSLVAPDTRLHYWDYQGRVTFDLTKRDTIGIFVFGSYDDLQNREAHDEPLRPLFNTQFHRVDLRYDRNLGDSHLRVAATLGIDSTLFQTDGSDSGNETQSIRERMVGLRVAYDAKLSDSLRVRAGADATLERYDLVTSTRDTTYTSTDTGPPDKTVTTATDLYPPRNELIFGVRGDAVWRPHPRIEMVPGLRLDVFVAQQTAGNTRAASADTRIDTPTRAVPALDPRLSVRIAITKKLAWVSTFGISHQPPSFLVPVPGFRPGSLGGGLQTSAQWSEGVDVMLPAELSLTATTFLHTYLDLTDVTATCASFTTAGNSGESCAEQRVRGRTIGLELLLRRSLTKRLTGWLSYTLSRSTRETSPIVGSRVFPSIPASEIPSEFDRTHVLSVVGALDLGSGFRAGSRFFVYSGRPYTRTFMGYPYPPFNSERMPGFQRLDVRFEKSFHVGTSGRISIVLEGLNVLFKKEVVNVNCTPRPAADPPLSYAHPLPDPCTFEKVGPISVPSLGVEGAF